MIIVTGGAGFIGSALVSALNERGESDILIVDDVDHDEKEHNIAPLRYDRLAGIAEFRQQLRDGVWDKEDVRAILHLGACSSTTENNWEYLLDNNVEYTKDIVRWAQNAEVRCVYASSAATYGDGANGFSDNHDLFDVLQPLNLYGKSKLMVDIWARDGGYLNSAAGMRYFNVFGPNEWHKGDMRSVVAKKYDEMIKNGGIALFKSFNDKYRDGEQERDFIYVTDAVAATLYFMDHPKANGVFNVGAGRARTWNDLAAAMFEAAGKKPKIEYIDMPADVKDQYQYSTVADISKLQEAGFKQKVTDLEEAVADYIQNYLQPHKHFGE